MKGQDGSRRVRRRSGWWAAALLSLAIASCSGGDSVTVGSTTATSTTTVAPTSSTSPPTTTAPTTAAPPTTVPPSTVAPDMRFDPPCVERAASGRPVPDDDPALDTLAPLGAEPVVQLELPRVVDGQGGTATRAGARRIPGGMLVDLRPYDGRPEPFGSLLAADADGSIRWQRCLDPVPDLVRVGDGGRPDEFVVGWTTYGAAGPVGSKLEVWSLADGTISRSWDEVLATNGITGAPTGHRRSYWLEDDSLLVLGPSEARAVEPTDTLLVVDLATMAMRQLPYPSTRLGLPLDAVQLRVTDDGRLLDVDADVPGGRLVAVESAGGWSTDVADLDAAVRTRARFGYADDPRLPLVGVDSQGNERWRRDDVLAVRAEGFAVAVDGDVALASACSDVPEGDDWCPGPKLLAVDAATGRTLWQRDGRWGVSVIGDGRAMIAGPYLDIVGETPPPSPAWLMVDLATGEQVGTATWTDPWHFGIGCCDSPEGASVAGGVVFTVDEDTVEMWYPGRLSSPRP